jgi:hypothetical protein
MERPKSLFVRAVLRADDTLSALRTAQRLQDANTFGALAVEIADNRGNVFLSDREIRSLEVSPVRQSARCAASLK